MFRIPNTSSLEVRHISGEGWYLYWVADGEALMQLGPFRAREDPEAVLRWLLAEAPSTEVVYSEESEAPLGRVLEWFEELERERAELARLNRRKAATPDLVDVMLDLEAEGKI